MKHIGTKTITTERLLLRPFQETDAEPMYRNWASDPEVAKFLTWPSHSSAAVTKEIVDLWCANHSDVTQYQWAIVPKSLGEPIGSISAVRLDDRTGAATIGYCIGRTWWGQGIVPEALKAVIAFFFDNVGLHRIDACHDPRNPNSGSVMKKSGMTYEGTWRAAGINNQGICDESWYAILRETYEKRKNAPGTAIWEELYEKARAVQNDRTVSPFIEAGSVAAAILTKTGNIYVGVCIDTASTLGMCAERNAIANMLTGGEHEIQKVVAVMPDGKVGPPCGACREYMMQLGKDSGDIEVLLDLEEKQTVRLGELLPHWWGAERMAQWEN